MTKEEKNQAIAELVEQVSASPVVYLAETSELDAGSTSNLRRMCFQNDITLKVVKNTLLKRAMDEVEGRDYSPLYETLKGNTTLLLANVGNGPAKLIKEFRKKHDKPVLKGAYVEAECYIGDDQLQALADIKSKDELLGELIGLLQSPAKNVISALKSGGGTIAGLVKTLSER
ncbi:MAG TPA: 50S ribosomal protein L10 [Flavobacteriales bacterium]|nr:50S ribosomal protein L10 [Flavobacteriales bacterium]|tara:strand:+ start:13004 stop:13522 length:519 start_codon:yes stop_codon:yes gene_type:complete